MWSYILRDVQQLLQGPFFGTSWNISYFNYCWLEGGEAVVGWVAC
jgi:hypothetical protein